MNNSPAKYDFFPGCRAVIIKVGFPENKHLLGTIITCIKPINNINGRPIDKKLGIVWETDKNLPWYSVGKDRVIIRKYYFNAFSQNYLMPLPPEEGLILSEEELLLLCVKEK